MSRIPRICLVLALSFVLLAATVPAAHARTLARSQSSNPGIGSWFDAALAWIGFGSGASQAAPAHQKPVMKVFPIGSSGGSGVGEVHPNSCGSTLDPNGHCGGTGTGG